MSRRSLAVITAVAIALIGGLAYLAFRVTLVPDTTYLRVQTARSALSRAGLSMSTSSDHEPFGPLPDERVKSQSPQPGRLALKGTPVYLELETPRDEVAVPDLVARYADDAAALAIQLGLRPVGIENSRPFAETRQDWSEFLPDPGNDLLIDFTKWSVVVSQEPTVGARVPYGSVIQVTALSPHGPSDALAPEVRRVHGLFWMRYGTDTSTRCNSCHTPEGCTQKGCHFGEEPYATLSRWAESAGYR